MELTTMLGRTRARDLLLPVGAALVTAGLEYLSRRELDQRKRLAILEDAVRERRAELAELGGEQPADEPGPDARCTLTGLGVAFADRPRGRRGGWGRVALFTACATVGAAVGGSARLLYDRLAETVTPIDAEPEHQDDTAPPASDPGGDGADFAAVADRSDFADEFGRPILMTDCGWPGCDLYEPDTPDGRAALALHRNRCTYRPAGAHVD